MLPSKARNSTNRMKNVETCHLSATFYFQTRRTLIYGSSLIKTKMFSTSSGSLGKVRLAEERTRTPGDIFIEGKKGIHDLWALFLFVASQIIAGIIFSVSLPQARAIIRAQDTPVNMKILVSIFPLAATVLLSIIPVFVLFKKKPLGTITACFGISAAILGVSAVSLLLEGSSGGIFLLIFLIPYILSINRMRAYFPLSASILRTVCNTISTNPGIIAVVTFLFVVEFVVGIFYVFALGALSRRIVTAADLAVFFYCMFAFFWAIKSINGVITSVVSGTFVFLDSDVESADSISPVSIAMRHSLTTSLGSICLGSLMTTFANMATFLIRRQNSEGDRSPGFLYYMFMWFIETLEYLIERFNSLALVYVSIYGYSYFKSASKALEDIKRAGAAVIVNDNVVETVLFVSGLFFLSWSCLLGGIVGWILSGTNTETAMLSVIAGTVGASAFFVMGSTISAGSLATIVLYCIDPRCLQKARPELYERFGTMTPGCIAFQYI